MINAQVTASATVATATITMAAPVLTTVAISPGTASGTWNLVTTTTQTTTTVDTQVVTAAQLQSFVASLPAGTIVSS